MANGRIQPFEIKLLNIQGLAQYKINEIENIITDNTLLCLTETQQTLDKTKWNQSLNSYTSMRSKTEKKGGGLMLLHKDKKEK